MMPRWAGLRLPPSVEAHLVLLAATFFWGFSFLAVKVALADASPLLFNALRMTLAAVVLCALYFRRLRSLPVGALRAGLAVGTAMWIGFELQSAGLVYTSASKSAFLSGLCVVLVPLLLALFWRGRIHRYTLCGVALACAGLYLLAVPAARGFSAGALNRGDLLTLGSAVAFAFEIILVGRAARRIAFHHLVPVQVAVCALWMLLSLPIAEPHGFVHPTPRLLAALGATSLIATVFCFAAQAWAQRLTPPTHAALIFSLEPVFAAAVSYVFLGERLGARGLVGAVLILAGVLASELLGHVRQPEEELSRELAG
jgi:drug/metabolite transporter (DMT)-like permease